MLPEVEKYLETKARAEREAEQARPAIWNKYRPIWEDFYRRVERAQPGGRYYAYRWPADLQKERQELEDQEDRENRETQRTFDRAIREAQDHLRKSEDPLVRWIIANSLSSYPHESEIVLKALPATLEELNRIARAERWCPEWARLRDAAIRAGVLTDAYTIERRTDKGSWRVALKDNWVLPGGHVVHREGLIEAYKKGLSAVTFYGSDGRKFLFRVSEAGKAPETA